MSIDKPIDNFAAKVGQKCLKMSKVQKVIKLRSNVVVSFHS